MGKSHDLGSGYSYRFFCWEPDRDIQAPEWHAEHDEHPDVPRAGITIRCPHSKGKWDIGGAVHFDLLETQHLSDPDHRWTIESWDPLTLSPSILMNECGCHGFIQQGKWVNA